MNPKFTARLSVHADITVTYEFDTAATTKRPTSSDDGPAAAGSQDVIDIGTHGVPEPFGPPATATPPCDGAEMPVGVDEATTPDQPDVPEPSTPEADKNVDRLVAMLKHVLIDREGEAWCRLPTDDGHDGIPVPLRDRKVQSIREAQRVLGLASVFYDDAAERIDLLAGHSPTPERLERYFETVYPDPVGADATRARYTRESFLRLFETGIGLEMPGVKGTTWAAYNAITEWVDHHRPTRARHPAARSSQRLQSSWFGSGAKLKARAWNYAVEMAMGL